jgi:hypothetical protein
VLERTCSTKVNTRNAYKILLGKPEGKRPHGRTRCKWKNDIRIELREIG